ncbi:YjcZ family sporulation protein [Brevibacillus composti]|uniref:YjcZ family sporulation protein n=1 Tax=Brevibacillus composti TaxID=2796470 RepID=A0A7T5EI01_9BACL|nr:YjcZ family sporulation protein [Brevibacillus composti]QQE72985.1 YjcZ family sporulation protein [Brevibacillus composti]QUO40063.1 YjcZ family sporulation protein [Brevibacillus composti]
MSTSYCGNNFFDDNFALVLVLFILLVIVGCSCDN